MPPTCLLEGSHFRGEECKFFHGWTRRETCLRFEEPQAIEAMEDSLAADAGLFESFWDIMLCEFVCKNQTAVKTEKVNLEQKAFRGMDAP